MTARESSVTVHRFCGAAIRTVPVTWHGARTRAMVDQDGLVRVWDSVAGYYTLCHNLTKRQQARVRRILAAADC